MTEMNMDEYRKQAEELRQQAARLESEMKTFQAFNMCMVGEHVWEDVSILPVGKDGHHSMVARCARCGIVMHGFVTLRFRAPYDDDDEADARFGSLAGKHQHEILAALPQETSETDEKPTLPVENDGVYRVDVSHLIPGGDEE